MGFQQGISGLNAASRNLEVIGNNIANANTVGAKVSRAEFSDVYANVAYSQSGVSAGMGVKLDAVTQQFTQGSIRTTENPLDVAINGRGFFSVAHPNSSNDKAYTRNGQFQLDSGGYVVTNQGMRLQGYAVDATTGKASGVVGDIMLPTQGVGPKVTSAAELQLNLDARTAAPTTTTPAFNLADPKSYGASTSIATYDQQGNQQTLSLYFRRTAVNNQWDVYAAHDGTAVPALSAPGAQQVAVGRMSFTPDGRLDAANTGTLNGGTLTAGKLSLDVPFAASTLPVGTGPATSAPVTVSFTGTTQFGSSFGVTQATQDGYSAGQLTGFGILGNGMVEARYSNGKTLNSGQIALADFRNDQGLAPAGGNLWKETPSSGQPAVSAPGTANLGSLQGGALEESNVDLTQQLVDMITAQRAYQANAQTIKTMDQMLSTLVNLR
ncbi:MAG: flagellar hook protein FlgE [Pseudomonadota bacterium]